MLRTRLERRGIELGGVLLAAAIAGPVPSRGGSPSALTIQLSQGVLRTMMLQKFKVAVVALTACVGLAFASGVMLRAQTNAAAERPKASQEPAANDAGKAPPKAPTDESAKIKELRKQRIDTLTKLVEQLEALYRNGRVGYEQPLEGQQLLLEAQLNAAEKESERIELYKQAVAVLTTYEKLAATRHEAGRGTEAAILRIRASRLEIEIRLEQARAKEAKGK
jgi:hypothetical protein